ncbi:MULTISPECIES: hypothetical protein [unclassified Meiothermus]|uniref:hypothetical protein n=1 Tax=unclassified Meiothermus TaxID=370471 RepID=UPI001F42BEFE|nr:MULTISPECIES: hypothetical protein [unclassified Meiothermus]
MSGAPLWVEGGSGGGAAALLYGQPGTGAGEAGFVVAFDQPAGGAFQGFLLELGGKLGLVGERGGFRLLNRQVTQEHLERAEAGKVAL